MTYSIRLDDFSGLATIYEGDRVIARDVGKTDAERIVTAFSFWHVNPELTERLIELTTSYKLVRKTNP